MASANTNSVLPRPSMSVVARQSSTELITIEAGPERKKYLLHKGFLTHYSEYFRNALRGPWKEAEERVIPLHDIEPGVLNIFVNWLYTQVLPQAEEILSVAEVEGSPLPYEAISLLLAKAAAFGDRFMAPEFYEVFSSLSISRFKYRRPDYATIIFAFNNLPSHAPLLTHLVDRHCRNWNSITETDSEKALRDELAKDFLLRVMETYGKMMSLIGPVTRQTALDQVRRHVVRHVSPTADSDPASDDSLSLPDLDSDSDSSGYD